MKKKEETKPSFIVGKNKKYILISTVLGDKF
jgi:hypothetical protein